MIDLLAQAERSVEDLASELDLPVANVSQHLQILRIARMVEVRREGSRKFYRVADRNAFEIWRAIRTFGEQRLAEVDRVVKSFFGGREKLEPVSAEQLSQRIKDGDVIVLDVRPENEFNAGHIKGAVSIPIHDLKRRLKELPRKREIVAYCRGPYCVYARDAVAELTTHGFKARRLEIGLIQLRRTGKGMMCWPCLFWWLGAGLLTIAGACLVGWLASRNLAIAIFLACLTSASATIFNSNGTPNVQTLVDGTVDGGDTVTIPLGNFTLASSVTISGKGVKVTTQGSGRVLGRSTSKLNGFPLAAPRQHSLPCR